MRTLGEARERWAEGLRHTASLSDLQRAVRYNGPTSPCVAGSRSLCWKVFLLFRDVSAPGWSNALSASRRDYSQWSDHYLKFIKHPEELANVSIDPLADDPDSPWNTLRQDETIRAEIAQDVQRLPDEPLYRQDGIQTLIVDVLFVYCKLNPDDGGYRQGMHELLAPIVYVLYQDAVERGDSATEAAEDAPVIDMFDSAYLEHDAFALFAKIMERAKAFYEVKDSVSRSALASASRIDQAETSAIVERSKFIHENCLAKVDPELAGHLKEVEILPQIFLIRWIRLLLGREFPFDQLLVLWDAIFAVDPTLDLIDLICVAMLIRIRWNLLDADYSSCLQLLLKYPPPSEHHGPHTFVDDAVFLRNHLDASGGASLVLKYTGKLPSDVPSAINSNRPGTPDSKSAGPSRSRIRISRSPLSSPGKFIQQQGGVEAIFQGAARNVLERGEKLGINQAVRDAMGEIRRNVQGLNEAAMVNARMPATAGRRDPAAPRQQALASEQATRAIVALEKRNKLLSGMLEESIENLKTLATSDLGDKVKTLELVEVAAAKVQFVKVHLEDSTITVHEDETEETPSNADPGGRGKGADVVMGGGDGTDESVAPPITSPRGRDAGDEAMVTDAVSSLDINADRDGTSTPTGADAAAPELSTTAPTPETDPLSDAMDVSCEAAPHRTAEDGTKTQARAEQRPAPVPTRSTIAQSSFSWMLEPGEPAPNPATSSTTGRAQPGAPARASDNPRGSKGRAGGRTSTGNPSRERNAFLFGEVTSEQDAQGGPSTDDIFGMEPITRRGKGMG